MSGELVVVGDVLLDVDVHGRVDRLCPDAPAPVLDVERELARPGGAGLAAVLAGTGRRAVLVTALADDAAGYRLQLLLGGSVELVAGPAAGGTCVKTRFRVDGRSLLRADHGSGRPASGFAAASGAAVRRALAGAAAVLVSDYGRGVTGLPVVRKAVAAAVRRGVPVVWDPHPSGSDPVPGVTVVTPNLAEAHRVAGPAPEPSAAGAAAVPSRRTAPSMRRECRSELPGAAGGAPAEAALAAALARQWAVGTVAVTLGARGAVVAEADGRWSSAPVGEPAEGDPCGAGDAFAAHLTAALAAGTPLHDAVAAAVVAASGFVAGGGAGALRFAGAGWEHPALSTATGVAVG
ncbi:MAG TPA: PfkB family carbohydrate kinase [Pseudonocardia sp.]|nr:PfkB family carbohydrate kinase [Pseudonocardia sp.]